MNRRTLLVNSGKAVAGVALLGSVTPAQHVTELSDTHVCSRLCEYHADKLARQIIAETGEWKQSLERHGPMVVTTHGQVCCEITLPLGKRHPDWTFTPRSMTRDEQESFMLAYGKAGFWYLLNSSIGSGRLRGFILNGRTDGWNVSVSRK